MSTENLMSRETTYLRRHLFYHMGSYISWNFLRMYVIGRDLFISFDFEILPFTSFGDWPWVFHLWWLGWLGSLFLFWACFLPNSVSLDELDCINLFVVAKVIPDGDWKFVLYCFFFFTGTSFGACYMYFGDGSVICPWLWPFLIYLYSCCSTKVTFDWDE